MFYTRKKEEELLGRLDTIETEINNIKQISTSETRLVERTDKSQSETVPAASSGQRTESEKIRAAYALNLCTVSISQIIQYNDLRFMEHEYEAILNNLNLEKFPKDEPLLKILKQILDVISFFRIQEGDKAMLEKEYKMKMKNAIWSAIPNFSLFVGGDIKTMAISLAMQVGTGYMNYRKEVANTKLEREKEEWKLQRSAMEQLHGLQRELFDTAWRLADEYNFPDEYRLTERQINRFNEILTDTDNLRKYERLLYIQKYFAAYPPFWYYLGNAANAVYLQTGIDEYKAKACEYYERFISIIREHSLLREDQLVSSCVLEYCELISADDITRKEAMLDDAIRVSGEALDVVQLCALEYLQNNRTVHKAVDLLRMLVNEQYNTDVNAKLLSRLYVQALIENNNRGAYRELYENLEEKAQGILLFPMPEENSVGIEELSEAYLDNLKMDLLISYKSALGKIVSRYEHRYNIICSDSANDISLKFAELLQELLKVVQEFLDLGETNDFSNALREALNKDGSTIDAMCYDRKIRKNSEQAIGFCTLCENAFKSLCKIIAKRVSSCKSIGELSSLDVKLSLFCSKYNIYSSDYIAAPIEESESIADKILGESYESRRQQEDTIKKCVDKINSMKSEIILENNNKYSFYLRGTHEFERFFGNHKNLSDYKKDTVAILDSPGIILTTNFVQFKNKEISYSNIDYGKKNGSIRFTYDTEQDRFIEFGFDTRMININKFRELFEGLAHLTGTISRDNRSKEFVKELESTLFRCLI